MSYEYDVALSFAGEDRKFVEDCAEILRSLNINVFYDNYEKEVLLGKIYTVIQQMSIKIELALPLFLFQKHIRKKGGQITNLSI